MLIELLLAGQLGAAAVAPSFQSLRDEAAAQESTLTPEQRQVLLVTRGQLFAQALAACGKTAKTLEFDAVAEVRDGGRLKILASTETSSGCIARQIGRAKVPQVPFMPRLLHFGISYAPDKL